jgi:hypothetical protein
MLPNQRIESDASRRSSANRSADRKESEMKEMRIFILLLALLPVLVTGCATQYSTREVDHYVSEALISAQEHIEKGSHDEALQFTRAVLRIDPENADAIALESQLGSDITKDRFIPSALGVNKSKRLPIERSTGSKILLYLPDRFLDLWDIVSAEIHFGPGVYANAHATRAVQAGGGVRAVAGFGWYDQRCLGGQLETESSISLLCCGASAHQGERVGSSGLRSGTQMKFGFYAPGDLVYQDFRDYWAVGGSCTALLLGVSAGIHPIEIADFFLGFAAIDLGNDDFSHTRRIKLNRLDRKLLRALAKIHYSKKKMEKRD